MSKPNKELDAIEEVEEENKITIVGKYTWGGYSTPYFDFLSNFYGVRSR